MNLAKSLLLAATIGGLFSASAQAASCQVQGAKHAGMYELRGVMEVGSMIELSANGRFRYMLAYGAVDELAEGCWSDKGSTLELKPTKMQVSYGGNKFRKLVLRVKTPGLLVRDFGGGHEGIYTRVRR